MNLRRHLLIVFGTAPITVALGRTATAAQQPTSAVRIGYLGGLSRSDDAARIEALRQGLREFGYAEGRNIVIEGRWAAGKIDRLPAFAAELVRLEVAVIVTAGSIATSAAKAATSTIPIVMTNESDPVANRVIASLARPGGNITGLSNFVPELVAKRLEILREVVPKLSRVSVLWSSSSAGYAQMKSEVERAAKVFNLQLQYLDILESRDVAPAFQSAAKWRSDAALVLDATVIVSHRKQIIELAATYRLPVMYHQTRFVEDGGLMVYGVSIVDHTRRAATFVDKILKGAKPADLPVQQPTTFELVVNMKTAKALGITFPPEIMARVSRVIQ